MQTDIHDDVIKWKHFPRNWPFVREIHRSPVNFPHKGQWRGALMFSLIYAWINDWVNNREAGDLRRQHGHYDVIVMSKKFIQSMNGRSYHFHHVWCPCRFRLVPQDIVSIQDLDFVSVRQGCQHWKKNICSKILSGPLWRHRMGTFSALLALCTVNSPVNSHHIGQWRRALVFFLSTPKQVFEWTLETPVIWDSIAPIMASL